MTSEEALAEIEAAISDGRPANLEGADLEDAHLVNTSLNGANLKNANLRGANLEDAELEGADLKAASLRDANLRDANLLRANLRSASLSGADLRGAWLRDVDLYGASLRRADLRGADLERANLKSALLQYANMTNQSLTYQDLTSADLTGANLEGADLSHTHLKKADLEGANLPRAKLNRADRTRADLTRAVLVGADLYGAKLYGAKLTGANLTDAILTDTDGLDALSDANGVTWPDGFDPPTAEVTQYRAYGKKSAAILKLRKPDTPRAAKEFKKKYPTEFEVLKQDTQGRDFSDQVIAQITAKHSTPFDWAIAYGRYSSHMQRLCSEPNKVITLNIDLSDARFTDHQRKILGKIRDISRQSRHPSAYHPFFTIGWVRYCELPDIKTLLVEEVQSDVQGVRKGLKDPDTRRQLESGGLNVEEIEAATALLLPYTERFYEDAVGIVFDIAQKSGSKVEMLHYDTKRQFGSPSAVYTDLPRSMGMKLSPGSEVLPAHEDVQQTWKITPNRKRTSRPARKTSRGTRRRTSRR